MTDAPRLSVILNTAREGHSLPDNPNLHIFEMLIRELSKQRDCPPFEVVIADTEWESRRSYFVDNPSPFPVKHVDVGGYWSDHNCCQISRAKNQSAIHAEGELLVTVDDGTLLPPHFLDLMWRYYKKDGAFGVAWYDWSRCLAPRPDPRLDNPTFPEVKAALSRGGVGHIYSAMNEAMWQRQHWPIFGYGFVGFSADAFYRVNGYEEWLDGARGQEDIEFSLRLLRNDYRLVMDWRLRAMLQEQGDVAERFRTNVNPDGSPGWVKHCSSALAPILFTEIAHGTRRRGNAEPFPDRIWRQLHPCCRYYIRSGADDSRTFICPDCRHGLTLNPAKVPAKGLVCPRCRVAMEEDVGARVTRRGLCSLYQDPCPFVSRDPDTKEPTVNYTDREMYDPLTEIYRTDPDAFVRDMRAEHEEIVGDDVPDRATYVGVDWR